MWDLVMWWNIVHNVVQSSYLVAGCTLCKFLYWILSGIKMWCENVFKKDHKWSCIKVEGGVITLNVGGHNHSEQCAFIGTF
jgi:hypothetical protein